MEKEKKVNKMLLKKDCFVNSLKEVNCFLCNINKAIFVKKFMKKLK